MLTVLTVFSGLVWILMTLVPARPSRLEGNVDPWYPKECLRTTQSAGECPRVFRPSCGFAHAF
jgi:hypothetical protein